MNALCSANGVEWFTVGGVAFPVEDPVEVGLHAIGVIDQLSITVPTQKGRQSGLSYSSCGGAAL